MNFSSDFDDIIDNAFSDSCEIPAPSIDDQRAYVSRQKDIRDEKLTKNGTFVRLLDSLPPEKQLGEGWNITFCINAQSELYARVVLSETANTGKNRYKTHVGFLEITRTNDVGEHIPAHRFDDSDSEILYDYFDQLDADKRAGVLPNLSSNYEIFDPNTAIMRLSGAATERAIDENPPSEK